MRKVKAVTSKRCEKAGGRGVLKSQSFKLTHQSVVSYLLLFQVDEITRVQVAKDKPIFLLTTSGNPRAMFFQCIFFFPAETAPATAQHRQLFPEVSRFPVPVLRQMCGCPGTTSPYPGGTVRWRK